MTDGGLGGQGRERELLTGFLDWYRAVIERKADGLTLAQASEAMTPISGTEKRLAKVIRSFSSGVSPELEIATTTSFAVIMPKSP